MSKCPVFYTANLVGKKWTIVILQEVELNGRKGFNFISKRIGKISPKILSNRLKELESNGLIEKKIVSAVPLKTKYKLTAKGKDFQNLIRNIKEWDNKYSNIKLECVKQECVACSLY